MPPWRTFAARLARDAARPICWRLGRDVWQRIYTQPTYNELLLSCGDVSARLSGHTADLAIQFAILLHKLAIWNLASCAQRARQRSEQDKATLPRHVARAARSSACVTGVRIRVECICCSHSHLQRSGMHILKVWTGSANFHLPARTASSSVTHARRRAAYDILALASERAT